MVRGVPYQRSQLDRKKGLRKSETGSACSTNGQLDNSQTGRSCVEQTRFMPARMRGEQFDQKSLVTYSFFDNILIGNLLARHDERLVVVQFDVAQLRSCPMGDWVPLCGHSSKLANNLLRQLRRRLDSALMKTVRRVRGLASEFSIEGPFIPHQDGIALMMLAIYVRRDGNYDAVYRRVRRILELHRQNDDRDRYLDSWYPRPAPLVCTDKPDPGYPWTVSEFDAIEKMARLESATGSPECDLQSMDNRRRYNEVLLGGAWSTPVPESSVCETDAAEAADKLLRDFFNGPVER